ncbi:MAG: DUF5777 family beta-barrel protein [Rhodothermia bacterium]|nr:MAG: DUF5777 family beta-barrel protein [Rhodothermia bacterium]
MWFLKISSRVSWVAAILICAASSVAAQIPRERANPGGPVDEVFWAPNIITMGSVANLPKGNVNLTIMHVFGIATDGIKDLFGLDDLANIRIGLDYGLSDRVSIGFARSRFDKLFDFRFKGNFLRQTKDGRVPLELAIKGDMGIRTDENGFDLQDRPNYLGAVLLARKFSDTVSLQLTPMFSHFNTVFIESVGSSEIIEEENDHFALGIGGRVVMGTRVAILFEYISVIGSRSDGTRDEMGVALNVETGGHVFQLFLKTSQWLTEQHAIARNRDQFLKGDFRFGFNVNRVFSLVSN